MGFDSYVGEPKSPGGALWNFYSYGSPPLCPRMIWLWYIIALTTLTRVSETLWIFAVAFRIRLVKGISTVLEASSPLMTKYQSLLQIHSGDNRETQCKVVQRSLAAVSSLMSFDVFNVHFWHSSWSFVTIIIDGVACSSHWKLRKFMERRFVSLFSSLALFNLPNRSSIQKLWAH